MPDTDALLAELTRAKALFQMNTVAAVLGLRVVMTGEDCDGLFARLSCDGHPGNRAGASSAASLSLHGGSCA